MATYMIEVKTGSRDYAGTDANVYMQLLGARGTSAEQRLPSRDSRLNATHQEGGLAMNARILAGSLLAALLSLTVDVSAQHPDPAALRDRLQQAIGQGDVAAAVALFADDAIIETPVVCATTPCIGKAAIQKEIERRVANKQQPRTLKHYVSGDLLTTRVELASEAARKAGVDRIIFWLIYETKDGKIVSERGVLYERTDPQTARYIEWLRSQSPAR